jgi:hypothetical protein
MGDPINQQRPATVNKRLDPLQLFKRVAEAEKMTIIVGPGGQVEVKGWEFMHIEKIGSRVGHNWKVEA